jgi:hypothetical protein
METTMPTIFLSYRRGDSQDATGRIYDHLVRQFSKDSVFKDVDSIPLGTDFRRVLEDAIRRADVVLAVIGPAWLTVTDEDGWRRLDLPDDFVRLELETALRLGKRVIPVPVSGAAMVTADDLPESLKQLAFQNGMPVRPDPDFHNDMARLLAAIGGRPRRPAPGPENTPAAPGRRGPGCALVGVAVLAVLLGLPLVAGLAFVALTAFRPVLWRAPDPTAVGVGDADEPLPLRLERARSIVAAIEKDADDLGGRITTLQVEIDRTEQDLQKLRADQQEGKQSLRALRDRLRASQVTSQPVAPRDRDQAERTLERYEKAEAVLKEKSKSLEQARNNLAVLKESYASRKEEQGRLDTIIAEVEIGRRPPGDLPRPENYFLLDSDQRLAGLKEQIKEMEWKQKLLEEPPGGPGTKTRLDLDELLRRIDAALNDPVEKPEIK